MTDAPTTSGPAGAIAADLPFGTELLSHLRLLLRSIVPLASADGGWLLLPGADDMIAVSDGASVLRFDVTSDEFPWLADRSASPEQRVAIGSALPPFLAVRSAMEVRSVLVAGIWLTESEPLGELYLHSSKQTTFGAPECDRVRAMLPALASALELQPSLSQARRLASRHERMIGNISDGVIVVDASGSVASLNEAALGILKIPSSRILGRSITRVLGDLNGWLLEAIDRVISEQVDLRLADVEVFVEDNECWLAIDLALLPLLGETGSSCGLMLLLRSLELEKALQRTMARYVSQEAAERLVEEGHATSEGRCVGVTVLFSDIRDFTSLSERIGPVATVSMLNEYFSFMEDVVVNRGGRIDKYIGDAVMAVFDGSERPAEAAFGAVAAATDMVNVLAILNAHRQARGEPEIRIGIGAASGTVVSGNIGSPRRMDYTVIGDAVNLASRVESLTKGYAAEVLIDGATRAMLDATAAGTFALRRVDRVSVKGQNAPTDLYQVAAQDSAGGAGQPTWREGYELALDSYLGGRWREAAIAFEHHLTAFPQDKTASMMHRRCRANQAEPPSTWDGVTRLSSK